MTKQYIGRRMQLKITVHREHTYCAYASNCYGWATGRCSKQTTELKKKEIEMMEDWCNIFFAFVIVFPFMFKVIVHFPFVYGSKNRRPKFSVYPISDSFCCSGLVETSWLRSLYGFICFLFLYFLKHNISSEENDDTTHQDRVIPNIIYSLQYYRADCEFWWCACIFIVLLNPAKLDQILRNHIPTERRQPLLCVCTLICMTMRMIQWVVNGIAMPLNVIWFFFIHEISFS